MNSSSSIVYNTRVSLSSFQCIAPAIKSAYSLDSGLSCIAAVLCTNLKSDLRSLYYVPPVLLILYLVTHTQQDWVFFIFTLRFSSNMIVVVAFWFIVWEMQLGKNKWSGIVSVRSEQPHRSNKSCNNKYWRRQWWENVA